MGFPYDTDNPLSYSVDLTTTNHLQFGKYPAIGYIASCELPDADYPGAIIWINRLSDNTRESDFPDARADDVIALGTY